MARSLPRYLENRHNLAESIPQIAKPLPKSTPQIEEKEIVIDKSLTAKEKNLILSFSVAALVLFLTAILIYVNLTNSTNSYMEANKKLQAEVVTQTGFEQQLLELKNRERVIRIAEDAGMTINQENVRTLQ